MSCGVYSWLFLWYHGEKGGMEMEKNDNYRLQLEQAKQTFLKRDQEKIIAKLNLDADEAYLYPRVLDIRYRICRETADFQKYRDGVWVDANSHSEVMTLLDLICDSREDRHLKHVWKDTVSFGQMFHRQLQERDPWAERFDEDPEGLARACEALGGVRFPKGDVAYVMEFFDGLPVLLQLWLGDEEFPSSLRFLWDENALMYLKYETMYFAKSLLLHRLAEQMER